jgi:hypothetical protein
MKHLPWLLFAACKYSAPDLQGGDDAPAPDADIPPDAYVLPAPEVIPGGGVADGPIVDGLNIYVLDEDTDLPVPGAPVTVGSVTGTTDAEGLFVAAGVSGKQSVLVTATGFRAQLWVGVTGANVTILVQPEPSMAPRATVTGNITGFSGISVANNHVKRATVNYSQQDNASDAVNNLATGGNTNTCSTGDCTYSLTARTGTVALFAPVIDIDTKGTGTPQDDTSTLITYAYRTGISLADGATTTGQSLTLLPQGDLVNVSTEFGTAPAGLPIVFGFIGLELGDDGTALLAVTSPGNPARVPALSAFAGSTYRVLGIASNNDGSAISLPIRRGGATTALSIGTWLPAPGAVTASRQEVTFGPATGANIHTVELSDDATDYLGITILDDTTTIAIPSSVELPTTALEVVVAALGTTLDVASFGFDAEREKVTDLSLRTVALP